MKLLIAHMMTIIFPVCIIFMILMGVWGILRIGNPVQHRDWVTLLPSFINSTVIDLSNFYLRKDLLEAKPSLDHMRHHLVLLEAEGIDFIVTKDGKIVYETGKKKNRLNQVYEYGNVTEILEWSNDKYRFVYHSPYNGWGVVGTGTIPFLAKDEGDESTEKYIMEAVIGLVLMGALIVIFWFGYYVSKRMSDSILDQLENLQAAARSIKQGDLDFTLEYVENDELGQTCAVFDDMRNQLKANIVERNIQEEQRKQLLAGISHDLATPLTSIKGFSSGILDGIAKTPEKQRHYVKMIQSMALTMENLVETLRSYSKLDMGEVTLNCYVVEINEYFHDFVNEKGPMYEERHLPIRFHGSPEPIYVSIDSIQFGRVITNILENSIKYNRENLQNFIDVMLSMSTMRNTVIIDIADHGYGVADSDLNKIFTVFYRGDKSRTAVASGSGIGLAVVKQIVHALNGSVQALKTLGGGLTIRIELPIQNKGDN